MSKPGNEVDMEIEPAPVFVPTSVNMAEEIRHLTPTFDGSQEGPTWEVWLSTISKHMDDLQPNCPPTTRYRIMITLFHPSLKRDLLLAEIGDYDSLKEYMVRRYPAELWANFFMTEVYQGTLFIGMNIHAAKARARTAMNHYGGNSAWCTGVLNALMTEFQDQLNRATNDLWEYDELKEKAQFWEHLNLIEKEVLRDQKREARQLAQAGKQRIPRNTEPPHAERNDQPTNRQGNPERISVKPRPAPKTEGRAKRRCHRVVVSSH
ncbi:hypothetical protein BJ085DRAFT_41037 [Dimargaris cristalligena]|uniref:Retrotransposon gag domain-containing protein n=1 Tax=Dimargaris cristalligena TaxID=215637 RepID=A0A4P9ZMB6_9FUNG|nr:hypothetical protein BJ085DRAFT_41037 [Dimargaris cristalligena]|eukprot:RKP34288.1 hypothetical protein BJ085DRAFT_41037 [Dimargaris cristalligena]